ncbi:cytochrome b/b6 domain-containing protein [Aureimonas psammosilenae]|uniref:cytochrome b/b6 domain-containing protein n=1 Tax=Aureimonas psammosilenae TaxID=2495496 RepID=UPI0012613249|nr:cytochrome b/b6 domain-containing protein [Aureimonas psammosilenae]
MTAMGKVRGYNAGAMLLHWAIALAIILQIAGGFAMMHTQIIPDALRFTTFQWHKTIGLLVLALTLARIAWRLLNPPPAHAPMSRVESGLAHLVHFLFYLLMLAVPLAGWLVVSVSPTAIPTLLAMSPDLPWPHLPLPAAWKGEGVSDLAGTMHAVLAYSTLGLLVLHVAGAIKHSAIDREPSFSRMMPLGRLPRQSTAFLAVPLAAGLAVAFFGGGLAAGRLGPESTSLAVNAAPGESAPAATGASAWTIDKTASSIRYEVAFSGNPIGGTLGRWDAAIAFDPAKPTEGSAKVTVDAASIDVEDAFVKSNVPGPDGFDVAAHPTVTLSVDRFEAAANGFVGHGTMNVKDKIVPLYLPFIFTESDGRAHVTASVVLDRLVLGLGLQNDSTAQWLGKDVTVKLDLFATRAGAASPQS